MDRDIVSVSTSVTSRVPFGASSRILAIVPVSTVFVSLVAGVVFGLALASPPGPMNAIIAEESVLRGYSAGVGTGVGAMLADVLFFLLALVGVATVVARIDHLRNLLFLVGGVLMLAFAVDAFRQAAATTSFSARSETGADSSEDTSTGEADVDGTSTEEADGAEDTSTEEADADAPFKTGESAAHTETGPAGTGFKKAFLLSITNPYQLAFWATVGIGLVEPGTLDLAGYLPETFRTGGSAEGLVIRTGSPALLAGFFGGIALWVLSYPAALVAAGRRVDALAPVVAGLSGALLGAFGVAFCWIGLTALFPG